MMKTHKISNQLNSIELKKKEGSTKCACCSKHKSGIRHQLSEVSRTFALFPPQRVFPRYGFSLNYFFMNPLAPAGVSQDSRRFPLWHWPGQGPLKSLARPSSHPVCPRQKLDSLSWLSIKALTLYLR